MAKDPSSPPMGDAAPSPDKRPGEAAWTAGLSERAVGSDPAGVERDKTTRTRPAAEGRGRGNSNGRGRNAAEGRSKNLTFPQAVLNTGFLFALVLAGASLLSGVYHLSVFQCATNDSIKTLLLAAQRPAVPMATGGQSAAVDEAKKAQRPAAPPVDGDRRAETDDFERAFQATKLRSTDLKTAIFAQVLVAKIALLSCGIFVGMAFGFLGFALFLLGIRAEMDVDARSEAYQVKLARLSPGVFVILCAAVMITVCATHESSVNYKATDKPGTAWQAQPRSFDDDYEGFVNNPKMDDAGSPGPATSEPAKKEASKKGDEAPP